MNGAEGDDEPVFLKCCHGFHAFCIKEVERVGETPIAHPDFQCPECRQNNEDMNTKESELYDVQPNDDGGADSIVVSMDAASTSAADFAFGFSPPAIDIEEAIAGVPSDGGGGAVASQDDFVPAAQDAPIEFESAGEETETALAVGKESKKRKVKEENGAAPAAKATAPKRKPKAKAKATKTEAPASQKDTIAPATAIDTIAPATAIATIAPNATKTQQPAQGTREIRDMNKVFCSTCASECDVLRARVKNKSAGTFQCKLCDVKYVQLSKLNLLKRLNSSAIPEKDRAEFFNSIPGVNGKELEQRCQKFLSLYEVHETYYVDGGKFLPLGVWQTMGYNIQTIEANTEPKDIMQHKVLGTVYRVAILEEGDRGHKGNKTADACSKANAPPAPAAPPAAPPVEEDPSDGEKEPSSSSNSNSSSSSSSSASKKKKKKNKKTTGKKNTKKNVKKDKKHAKKVAKQKKRLQEEKAAVLTQEREKKKATIEASVAQKKIEPMLLKLNKELAKPCMLLIPEQVHKQALAARDAMDAAVKKCEMVTASPSVHKFLDTPKDSPLLKLS